MLQKYKSKREEGFTIIEVLIVLAIAGLIILIVFLAVPALQRNSRNTARRNDVARIGGATQEFINNSNGRLPVAGDSGTIAAAIGNTGHYDFVTTPGNLIVAGAGDAVPGLATDTDIVTITVNARCDGATAGLAVRDAATDNRQIAVLYAVESAGAPVPVCQEI